MAREENDRRIGSPMERDLGCTPPIPDTSDRNPGGCSLNEGLWARAQDQARIAALRANGGAHVDRVLKS